MNRLSSHSLAGVVITAVVAMNATAHADADAEVGVTAGIHTFAHDNELGVPDEKNAPSERNSALFGLRGGYFFTSMFGIEGEFGIIPSEARQQAFSIWNLVYRAHLVAQFLADDPTNHIIPFAVLGGGATSIVSSSNRAVIDHDTDASLYFGIGGKWRLDSGFGIRADARMLFPPSSQGTGFTEDFEFLLSVYKDFGYHGKAEPTGPKDTDGDGIPDDKDKCPNEPEDKDGFQDQDGCPDLDNDNDGIPDKADKCPNEPEDKDGFQDQDGCPDLDNDNDGIPDAQDKCPNEPEDKDGFQDQDGCPDPDNDNDGVPDAQDKCPDQPETKNGYQDEDGCPDEIPASLKAFTGAIQGINFKVGSEEILATSNKVLDKAVAVLKEFHDLKLEIQGHTDDQGLRAGGKFKDNTELSQARADSVKAYLVSKGIEEPRLTAKGYGDSKPVEDPKELKGGKLDAARAKNRRVEFKLLSALTQ